MFGLVGTFCGNSEIAGLSLGQFGEFDADFFEV